MKIMLLGGSHFQLPPIRYAKGKGYEIVLCDYLPDNPGKDLADVWHSVSTTDREAILAVAKKEKIDGIAAYASDPAAPTAAYVAEKLGLPGNPYQSVEILARKDLYREFLHRHGFHAPKTYAGQPQVPCIIKPVDSSGSKGISIVHRQEEVNGAIAAALPFSRCKKTLAEQLVGRKGYQIAGDGFVVDGKLVFRCFANEHFNPGGIVPIGESFPYIGSEAIHQKIHGETQRLLDLLNMKMGALNFDAVIDENDNVYLMEIGPRNGGNLIPDVIKYATGVDLVAYTVEAALGKDCTALQMVTPKGFWASFIIHSRQPGRYAGLEMTDGFKQNIVEQTVLVKTGDEVKAFTGSHCTLGTMILKFSSQEDMLQKMDHMEDYMKVMLQ